MTTKPESERLDPALRKLIAVLIIGAMAPLLDTTIVNVAVDTIGRDLHTSVSMVQWVSTGYLLAMGMAIPTAGWAIARFGGKQMWLASLVLFLISSVLAGAAWDIGSLIAFRVLQGLSSGLILPIVQTLLMQAAKGRHLGRLMAAASMPAVIAPILGPVIGGLIVSNLSWRWIFFINIPLCFIGLYVAWRGLEAGEKQGKQRLDVLGLLLLSPGVALLLFGLSRIGKRESGADALLIVPLVLGVVLLVAFVAHALRTQREPIIDLRLFRVRSFSSSASLLFLSGLALYSGTLLVPLYLQQSRGMSAFAAGLLLVPQGIGALLARGQVGKLTDRMGPRPVVLAGIVLTAAATLGFTQAAPGTSDVLLGVYLLVFGAGISAVSIAVLAAAYQGLNPAQVPHASGATRILMQIGGSIGTAVIAIILSSQVAEATADAPGLSGAFNNTFWWAFGFTLVGLVPALILPSRAPKPAAPTPVASTAAE